MSYFGNGRRNYDDERQNAEIRERIIWISFSILILLVAIVTCGLVR